ncbi:ROK family protein [Ponticaulis sp.]|uniref:ROK family protein n=1 Tax=Ponticaulis sp. TaxID=2020902 RepID=UPI000B6F9997|nr:ROK family protein [Ponticaulis sp.]MAI91574.1 fructokinase [Ponticaulis sp.]OUX97529.1 MAG: hypothetical protein CBB65_14125 [Hyphomonadaceae bacterium TMED5]|tara:strand:- start:35847 stop:36731 length:885 start_codon:yes stop_codon:yes gene_type:complete
MLAAIEAGGTKFVLAVAHTPDKILDHIRLDTKHPDETMAEVIAYFRQAEKRFGTPISKLGIGAFGPITIDPKSPDYGVLGDTGKVKWIGASFPERLAEFKVPMKIDTDVNGSGIGEALKGAGEGLSLIAYVTVGTGVGIGITRNGSPMHDGISPFEMGHVYPPRHPEDDFPGNCPPHGPCLEGLACGPSIKERWGTDLSSLPSDHIGLKFEAHYLGHLAQMIILTHAPDRIVFGGGVMKTPGLMDMVREKAEQLLNGYIRHERLDPGLKTYICPPSLDDLAGIQGALYLAEQAV